VTVKAIWFLKRRPDMSPDDFHRYWREHHGPLFCNAAPAQRYVTRYEQNHATPENGAMSGDDFGEYDGVSIMWFRSVEDLQLMFADPGFAHVLEDGDNFLESAATQQIVTFDEEPFALGDTTA
jgi:uncharacterized protein (TIGR02118 family)